MKSAQPAALHCRISPTGLEITKLADWSGSNKVILEGWSGSSANARKGPLGENPVGGVNVGGGVIANKTMGVAAGFAGMGDNGTVEVD